MCCTWDNVGGAMVSQLGPLLAGLAIRIWILLLGWSFLFSFAICITRYPLCC